MNNMPHMQMKGHGFCHSPVAYQPTEELENMYPEIYHRVYPKIVSACEMMDTPTAYGMYPYPSRDAVERLTDNIYDETVKEIGNIEGNMENTRQPVFFGGGHGGFGGYGGYGRRPFLRDLIGVLLLRELIGRRRPYYPYPYPY